MNFSCNGFNVFYYIRKKYTVGIEMLNSEEIHYEINITSGNHLFWIFKRLFDLTLCFLLFPLLIIIIGLLIFLNFFYNKGTVFFIQKRMGKDCKPFYAIKFRTMKKIDTITRRHFDPLEVNRITKLGYLLRKSKIDELPQILNVIKGDMSLIGPRPDYYEHAIWFLKILPSYRSRHAIRPGISGLSQIRLGYAEGISATKKKSKIDNFYIKNANFKLDAKIFFGTILIILKGK
jgi:lipopolysaccharide/colanic/teichoic acid biosynthesis glycosyltransferase